MNEMIVFGMLIIIIVVVIKCVILIRYLSNLKKKGFKKYQKSNALYQLKIAGPEDDSGAMILKELSY